MEGAGKNDNVKEEMSAYLLAERYALYTNRSLFISGGAGTGKTTFIHELQSKKEKYIIVVAPTGIAAINAGGVTIHSLFQLPLEFIVPTSIAYQQMFSNQKIGREKRDILLNMETLIIDEISMVRPDILDAIDAVLKFYRNEFQLPFGGVQVIMIGDLYQLPPVVTKGVDEQLMKTYYQGPYFFFAKSLENLSPIFIEFDKIFRQTNTVFIDLLNEVRENRLSQRGMEMLRQRYKPNFEDRDSDFHVTLTTHNHIADRINLFHLDDLEGEERHFDALIHGDFPVNSYPTEVRLTLKVGARVMFIRNDEQPQKRYYNGKTGTVIEMTDNEILVQCDDIVIDVVPVEWKNVRYIEDPSAVAPKKEVVGVFIQFPLRLAWAITIHKSQGMTFDKVIIDAQSAFAFGQVYVALSRCRTLEGIILSTPILGNGLGNDPTIIRYMKDQPNVDIAKNNLMQAEKIYEKSILLSIFDFSFELSVIDGMMSFVQNASSFNDISFPFLQTLYKEVTSIDTIAHKFHSQIERLLYLNESIQLSERLKKADIYFSPLLQKVNDAINNMPIRCKNKKDASQIYEDLTILHNKIEQKLTYLQVIWKSSVTKSYLQAKSAFKATRLKLKNVFEAPKIVKGASLKITLTLFLEGLSLQDIAIRRGLTLSTVYSHFSELVKSGCIKVEEVLPEEIIQRVTDAIIDNPHVTSLTEIRHLLNDEIDYEPIRLVKAGLQNFSIKADKQ